MEAADFQSHIVYCNRFMLNYLETFEGWLLIVYSDCQGYHFQTFNSVGEQTGKFGVFLSVPSALHNGRKFITGAKLKD